jgi:hypothetical protein
VSQRSSEDHDDLRLVGQLEVDEGKDVGLFLLMSHLLHDDAVLLFLGELRSWADEDFAVILHASQQSTVSAQPGLLGGDWLGRMMTAA